MVRQTIMRAVVLLGALLPTAAAFGVPSSAAVASVRRSPAPAMGLFDGFASAFANDDSLGDREDAGLSKAKQKLTVTWVGPRGQKKTSTVVAGQKLRDIARGSGVPIVYDCSEGTCKTCEAQVGNGRAKICVAKMPNKDVTIVSCAAQ